MNTVYDLEKELSAWEHHWLAMFSYKTLGDLPESFALKMKLLNNSNSNPHQGAAWYWQSEMPLTYAWPLHVLYIISFIYNYNR